METEIIELENGKKYAVISSTKYDNNEYILITEVSKDEENISEELEIVKRDNGNIVKIEEELEYELLKEVFERKLELKS